MHLSLYIHVSVWFYYEPICCVPSPLLLFPAKQFYENKVTDRTNRLYMYETCCLCSITAGTGSNAAFVEYIKNIERWDECYKDAEDSDLVSSNSRTHTNH